MAESYTGTEYLQGWTKSSGVVMATGIIGILVVMMIPLPTLALDIFLTFNITITVVILLMSMYVLRPLDFSAFPSILLVVTLLRLSLNVASTRLILLHGNEGTAAAGQVIKAFGSFVVGGNYVVGLIVFLILIVINFVVITKGATRIAEVSARFTLDAMPGKQMSIDADLNAGLITDSEARERRRNIEREADFYGSMDGASKFVRGDAIAGIIITLINILGGLIIGVLQQGMTVADAAHNYTLLTVGDGLVTQVPALIVSTAAGLLVTRSTSSADLGEEITGQLFVQPKAIITAAVIIFFFGLVPGMPKLSFIGISLIAGTLGYVLFQASKKAKKVEKELPAVTPVESVEALLPLDLLELDVGYGLIPLVDAQKGGELLQRIKALRKQLAIDIGFIVPAIHIRDNLQLRPNEYSVTMKGVQLAGGEVMPGYYLALTSGDKGPKIKGIEAVEPAFGLPAVWVSEKEKEDVQAKGYIVVDPATVITTHLTEIIKSHADELLGRQEVQSLLDTLSINNPKVVEEVVPKLVPLGALQKVLQRLLRERVSIRDLLTILETMADYAPMTKNVDMLTEYVRASLSRSITGQYRDKEGSITVAMLSPEIEDRINSAVSYTEYENQVSPDPNFVQKVVTSVRKFVDVFTSKGLQPIILCSPGTRSHFRKILERFLPDIVVLSSSEMTREVDIKSLGMVEVSAQ